MNANTKSGSIWSAGFIYLLLINVVNSCAFGMITPLVPGYVVSMGATLIFAGAVTGIFSIAALFARPLASVIGDRLNKKWVLMIFLCLNGCSVVLYSFVPEILWLLLVRILHGLMFSVSGTVSLALGTEYVPKERLGEGVGYLGIGQIIGMAIGPNIGIYLIENHTYPFIFLFGGFIILAVGLSVSALRYEHPEAKPLSGEAKRAFRIHDLIAVELLPNAAFVAILAVGYGLTNSYLVMFGDMRAIENIGLYFIVYSAVLLLTRPFIGIMIDRKGVEYAIIPGFVLASASMFLIGFSHRLLFIIFAAVLSAVGAGGAMPAIQVDCLKKLDSGRKTVATATYLIGLDVGISMGQISGGILTNSFGFDVTFHSAGALMLAGLGFYLLCNKPDKHESKRN